MTRAIPEVVTLADGPVQVDLLPSVGARLHRLRAFGHDLLHSPEELDLHRREPLRWGGYVMAPWCNRIAAHPITVLGRLVDLPANFTDRTAIHGQVFATAWDRVGDGLFRVEGGGDGWPWRYECTFEVAIQDTVVRLELGLTNRDTSPMPAGVGLHPWFRRPSGLRINASEVIRSNLDPGASPEAVSGDHDRRSLGQMPEDFDATWCGPGEPAVELAWREQAVMAALRARADGGVWIAAASPAAVDAMAVEPQTHAPFGLRRLIDGDIGGMLALAPQATLRLEVELTVAEMEA